MAFHVIFQIDRLDGRISTFSALVFCFLFDHDKWVIKITSIHIIYERLTSLCRISCFLKTLGSAKLTKHHLHDIGFSPVCCRIWISHVDLRADLYPHTLHMNGLMRLCTALMCLDSVFEVANSLEQMSQVFFEYQRDGAFLSICTAATCCRSWLNCSNDWGHDEHRKPASWSCTWRWRKIFTEIWRIHWFATYWSNDN